jgi:hypothetical protein
MSIASAMGFTKIQVFGPKFLFLELGQHFDAKLR